MDARLLEALQESNINMIRKHLDQGEVNADHILTLMRSLEFHDVEIFKLLVEYEVSVYEIVRVIFSKPELVHCAYEVVAYILNHHPDKNKLDNVFKGVMNSTDSVKELETNILELLLDKGLPVNGVVNGVSKGNLSVLKNCIQNNKFNWVS